MNRLKRRGLVKCFVFARKSPGLRLRFGFHRNGADSAVEIVGWLDERSHDGLIERWYPTVYEPEIFKFGGPDAMAAVHEYFSADSSSWWQWEKLRSHSSSRIGPAVWSLAILNDLFHRFLDGPEEVWDVWRHIAALHGGALGGGRMGAVPARIGHLLGIASAKERAVLRKYELANMRITRHFRILNEAGRLLYAYRLVLPHVALYHWNRYGFRPDDRQAIFSSMVSAWSPAVHDSVVQEKE